MGGLLCAFAIPFIFSGCKDDEPKPAGIGFETSLEEITESDGTIKSFHPLVWQSYSGETGATGREHQVKLLLDKGVSATSVVSYTIAGTASRNTAAIVGDYEIAGASSGSQSLTIEKGATEIVIPITIFEDMDFEITEADSLFETIELTLTGVVSGPIKLGDQTTYKLKIHEDDAVWILQWGTGGTDDPGDVDMDLLFTFDGDIVWGSASDSEFEAINVPAGFPPGSYGVSYTYYAGTSDDVDFSVGVFSSAGTLNGSNYTYPVDDPLIFNGHYTLANVNEWDLETSPPQIVQTMTKAGINYSSISDINEPASGSRIDLRSSIKIDPKLIQGISALKNIRAVH
jgi:hypothetical protein